MKCSLGMSNFLEQSSSLSHSIVFLIWSIRDNERVVGPVNCRLHGTYRPQRIIRVTQSERKRKRKLTGRRGTAEPEILGESLLVGTRQDHRNEQKTKPLEERNVRNSEDSKW